MCVFLHFIPLKVKVLSACAWKHKLCVLFPFAHESIVGGKRARELCVCVFGTNEMLAFQITYALFPCNKHKKHCDFLTPEILITNFMLGEIDSTNVWLCQLKQKRYKRIETAKCYSLLKYVCSFERVRAEAERRKKSLFSILPIFSIK